MPTAGARTRASAVFLICLLNVTVFAAAMSGLRRGTKDVVDILLRNSGHPRSKPMELPLLGHRARSCRSRRVRRHYARTPAPPGLIRAARPRRRRPAPPSHRRHRPLSASLPPRPVRQPAARVRAPGRSRAHSPHRHPPPAVPAGVPARVRPTRNAARSRSRAPCATATVAGRPPVARLRPPSPADAPCPALDFHQVLQGRSRSPNDVRTARCVATHRPLRRRASSPSHRGRDACRATTRHGVQATLPHAGALRHEPITRRIAPELRATHGVAAPVTNFPLREISDRGRPRSRPPAPPSHQGGAVVPPSERRRPGVAAPSARRRPHPLHQRSGSNLSRPGQRPHVAAC